MKKIMGILLAYLCIVVCAGCTLAAPMDGGIEKDVPLQEVTKSPGDDGYYQEVYEVQQHNFRVIRELPTAYDEESWKNYKKAASRLASMDPDDLSGQQGYLDACLEAQDALIQVQTFADSAWYIWGEDMASVDDPSTYEYNENSWDYPGFRPFLVPYMLDDQAEVKGNIIVVAGGGYSQRSNSGEGYPIAKRYNDMGYNAYVLQRRVNPDGGMIYEGRANAWMDLQRALRFLRYHADDLGLGGMDILGASGFSGGGSTVCGAVCYFYGNVMPESWNGSYVPDAIDAVNADFDVVFACYGPHPDLASEDETPKAWDTENPNLPAVFLASGFADSTIPHASALEVAKDLDGRTLVEVHLFANATHGFGAGQEKNNSSFWMPMADHFVDQVIRAKAEE